MSESKKSSVQDSLAKWNTILNYTENCRICASDKGILGKLSENSSDLITILLRIREYHDTLRYPARDFPTFDARIRQANDFINALFQEVAELQESWNWKPWRKTTKLPDRENIIVELVDILIFMGSIMELFNIPPTEFINMFYHKLEENYNRIERGYHDGND